MAKPLAKHTNQAFAHQYLTERKAQKAKSNAGRPTKMTPEVLAKLEEAFLVGASDGEACFYADISQDVLYDYQNKYPQFTERKHRLKERPVLLARQSVLKALPTDGDLALKFLERKRRDEFSLKTETQVDTNVTIQFGNIVPRPIMGGDDTQLPSLPSPVSDLSQQTTIREG